MSIAIRRARPSDLRRIAAVEDAGGAMFAEHFGDRMVPALTAAPPSGAERDGHGILLVAVDDRRLVGFAHVVPHDLHAHLEQVSVLPSYARQGIGTSLVRAVMEEARWSGYDRMSLTTYRDVPWNGPFYAGLGFVEVEPGRLELFQRDLRDHERRLGLDGPGVRVVMEQPLRRQVTGE
ncbi:GNAT family N-acetyltransferase [Nocardioides sp.]|uniref:GNAT family N-acetyltransferase n=1 Tax=Nocardioides sp. TaxID=35761 RepID=UPI002720D527|nr:GNAT family N-acetyltransferase [Nocardioides sp.]MDO9456771.1 GNAT family N-acetyltransferase [Nocardioides sp.]